MMNAVRISVGSLAMLVCASVGLDLAHDAASLIGAMGLAENKERRPNVGARKKEKSTMHEGEYVVTDFSGSDGAWSASAGSFQNGTWTVDLSQSGSATLSQSRSLLGQPKGLSLKVRAHEAGGRLRIRLGSHFQGFERMLGNLDGTEQTFAVPAPPEDWSHSGGENDGIVRYPLRMEQLEIEPGSGPGKTVRLDLLELRCATTIPREKSVTLLSTVAASKQTAEGRPIVASCVGRNLLDCELPGTLTLTLRDWEDQVLATEKVSWALPARGVRKEQTCTVTVPAALHFIEAEFRFAAREIEPVSARGAFARGMDDPGDPTCRPESPWGMGVYLYRYADAPDGWALMDRAAAVAQAAGVKWSREEFSWSAIERARGNYSFDFMDKVVDTAARHGISVYGLLAYWSEFTRPYTPEGIDDFCAWARAVVRHFKDRIKHWEIYNEPNIFFWSGPKELYPELVKKCYAAIKAEDPQAAVLAISTSGIDKGFIKRCLDAQAPFDVLTVHPYRVTLFEEGFVTELQETAKLVGNRPVWITEMGWSTQYGGTDERRQAQLLARCYLSAVASSACQNVSWYDFRDDGRDPFYNEANFGVLRDDLTPKPAYRALATVCRTLAKGTPTLRTDFGKGVYGLEMGDVLVLWAPASPCEVRCRIVEGDLRITNLMDEELNPPKRGQEVTLTLRKACPLFLTGARIAPSR